MIRNWVTITNGENTVKEFRKIFTDFHGRYIIIKKKALSRKIHKNIQKRYYDRIYLTAKNVAILRVR